ncbi:MAG TPA: hypothetical protein VL996_06750 [Methylocella sp.]|nr:hypothetical protein [Methylocella sp.]
MIGYASSGKGHLDAAGAKDAHPREARAWLRSLLRPGPWAAPNRGGSSVQALIEGMIDEGMAVHCRCGIFAAVLEAKTVWLS